MELGEYITGFWTFSIVTVFLMWLFIVTSKPIYDLLKDESLVLKIMAGSIHLVVFIFVTYVLLT